MNLNRLPPAHIRTAAAGITRPWQPPSNDGAGPTPMKRNMNDVASETQSLFPLATPRILERISQSSKTRTLAASEAMFLERFVLGWGRMLEDAVLVLWWPGSKMKPLEPLTGSWLRDSARVAVHRACGDLVTSSCEHGHWAVGLSSCIRTCMDACSLQLSSTFHPFAGSRAAGPGEELG